MNEQKLKEYNLTASVHTLSVKSEGAVDDVQPEVSNSIIATCQNKNGMPVTTSIINPNKLHGDVFTYSEFETVFDTILAGAGIGDYKIIRADLRLDSYDETHYRQYAKLNKYLISLLAVTYKVKNCYKTINLFSQEQLSVAIKNRYFEIENYDKDAESEGMDAAKSRLEERSKAWSEKDKDLRREFTFRWFRRWDKALNNTNAVHTVYNDELERIYNEGKQAYPVRFRSLTDFLLQYQDCIFCKAQMIDLLSRFDEVGPEKARTRAENHKKRYGIEYFSKRDLQRAVDEIKRATLEFFDN